MAGNLVNIDSVNFRRVFPWINLFRSFGIAIDPQKVLLAAFALIAISGGNWMFANLPFAPDQADAQLWPWERDLGYVESNHVSHQPIREVRVNDPFRTLVVVSTNWRVVLSPVMALINPGVVLLQTVSESNTEGTKTWADVAYAWTQLLWILCVWAVFGGAITRMVAVQFARDEKVGLLAALKFSVQRFLSYLLAPLLPIAGIGFFWLLCVLGGWIGRIPAIGEVLIGLFWIVPLFCGLFMALMLVGVAAGWPLMYATISAEASDGFDGLSRAYCYVYGRPWHYLWMVIVAMAFGSVVIFFAWLVTWLLVYLGGWSVASGMGLNNAVALFQASAGLFGIDVLGGGTDEEYFLGSVAVGAWMRLVGLVLVGFIYSYFWSAFTIMYFLLRRSDDGTEFDQVYITEDEQRNELLPLVGVAESDQSTDEAAVTSDSPSTE